MHFGVTWGSLWEALESFRGFLGSLGGDCGALLVHLDALWVTWGSLWSTLGALGGTLGSPGGPLWSALGALGGHLGTLLAHFGALGGRFGPLLAHFSVTFGCMRVAWVQLSPIFRKHSFFQ